MKKISSLKGIKVLSRKEQNDIKGAIDAKVVCRSDNRCYLVLGGTDHFLGLCRYGYDSGCSVLV
ncbi:hypothetical protein [Tenacibaculum sp. M341]|uniref:hypothetical protein n=1 Tax=Tenacibaculum sp. M341 TaxID=2530339 RepID=UPI00104D4336|nr:hypothetical protein [Tenacibaculum sp. M341]TCI90189.1 hypothetical protein EYW44_14750 [Tenacibaculum sp. M341]